MWAVAQSLPRHLARLTHLELDQLLDLEEVLVPAPALELELGQAQEQAQEQELEQELEQDLLKVDTRHKCVIHIVKGMVVVSKIGASGARSL
jgi:hypothetical protein